MSTDTSVGTDAVKVLLLQSKSIAEERTWLSTLVFTHLCLLIEYVSGHINSTEKFVLIVASGVIKDLMKDPIYNFPQVQSIYVYYDNEDDLQRDETGIQNIHKKLRFYHVRNLKPHMDQLKIDNAINSRSIDRSTVIDVASSWEERISAKRPNTFGGGRHSPKPKKLATTSTHGFLVKNIEQIDSRYICSSCKLVLREPYQLNCGHRMCQCCINIENDQMTCLICLQVSSNNNIWHDRGFRNEIQRLPMSCLVCDWTGSMKLYEQHIGEKHPDGENSAVIVDVYTQQTAQSRSYEPVYMTAAHHQILSDTLSSSPSMYVSNNSNIGNDHYHILLAHAREMISVMSNDVNSLINEQQRIGNEIRRSHISLRVIAENLVLLKASFEESVSRASGLTIIQDLFAQELWSLRRVIDDALCTSFDGKFKWKISGVQDKIVDARSERQKSIYSPPFYSSPNGYKMCLRLYLNGDNDVRGESMSLFLVIMQGDYDAILVWPFPFEVSFRLIDQSILNDHQHGIIGSFWPNLQPNCCQRPVHSMNEACGIKDFLSLVQFEQNQNRYVQDDTMFIEVKVDFLSQKPVLSSISSTGGSPNDDERVDTISENFMHMT